MTLTVAPVFILLTLFGTLINSLLIYIICSNASLRGRSTHSLLVNLAISDLLLDIAIIIIGLCNLNDLSLTENSTLCSFSGFVITFTSVQSLLALLLIAIDRYRMLVLVKSPGLTFRQVVFAVICQFTYSLLIALAPFMKFGDFIVQPSSIYCVGNWMSHDPIHIVYNIWCACTLWATVLIVAFLWRCTFLSVRDTHRNALTIKVSAEPANSVKPKIKRLHRRTRTHTPEVLLHETRVTKRMFRIVAIVFLSWACCGVAVVFQVVSGKDTPYWFDILSVTMATMGTLANPIINFSGNQKYRQSLWRLVPRYSTDSLDTVQIAASPRGSPRAIPSPFDSPRADTPLPGYIRREPLNRSLDNKG